MIHWQVRQLSCEPNHQLTVCTTSVTEDEVKCPPPPPQVIHYWPFQGGGSDRILCCLLGCQNFGDVSPYVCSLFFQFGLGCWVTTFWKIADPLGKPFVLIVFCLFLILVISNFNFESWFCLLIPPVPVYCFLITLIRDGSEASVTEVFESPSPAAQLKMPSPMFWILNYSQVKN